MTPPRYRIGFAGTAEFAAHHLRRLLDQHQVLAVLTQPDRPAGRGRRLRGSPVKELALKRGLAVHQPAKLDDQALELVKSLDLDLLIVVAYGLILSPAALALPRFGCINSHASLLPRWRGAAPVERAILAGDSETGISIMQMDQGLDTGEVLLSLKTPIKPSDTAASLSLRLAQLGGEGLERVLGDLPGHQKQAKPQNAARSTYARKLAKDEALIRWEQPAESIQRLMRALYPRSPAFCFYRGERLRLLEASVLDQAPLKSPGTITATDEDGSLIACKDSLLKVSRVQLPGKKPARLAEILRGRADFFSPGEVLTSHL